MLYGFLKIWVRLAFRIYFRQLSINGLDSVPEKGPLILACNHPNSFLDAILVCVLLPRPVHFLARGDVFKNPLVARILRALHLIPVYRLSEGKENLSRNDESFEACLDVLRNGGILLIFSEGICVHEWALRPLKKGTARIALRAWQEPAMEELRVMPVGITWHSFTAVPKTAWIFCAPAIVKTDVLQEREARFYNRFNELLKERLLKNIVVKDDLNDIPVILKNKSLLLAVMLAVPAFTGYIVHWPFYKIVNNYVRKKTEGTVFYDSVLFGMMLVLYPLFVLIIAVIFVLATKQPLCWMLLLSLPFTAWCYSMWKRCQA